MASQNDFIYCDPPYIGRNVDYYDSWDEQSESSLHKLLTSSSANFMLSTWDHNDYRQNDYIHKYGATAKRLHKNTFIVGAKETNRNPVVEALLTNYSITGTKNQLLLENYK